MQSEDTVNLKSKSLSENDISIEELIDIREVHIRTDLEKEERIADFIAQIKNPYICKCGDMIIYSAFTENDVKLSDKMREYFKMVQ